MSPSTTTIPTPEEVKTWFSQSHVTITFTTQSGGHYTLVARPKVTVLIKDNTGEAWRGETIRVRTSGAIELWTKRGPVRRTTAVTSFFVATN